MVEKKQSKNLREIQLAAAEEENTHFYIRKSLGNWNFLKNVEKRIGMSWKEKQTTQFIVLNSCQYFLECFFKFQNGGITKCSSAADSCRGAAAVAINCGPNRADGELLDGELRQDGALVNRMRLQRQPQLPPFAIGATSRKRTPISNRDTNHQSSNPFVLIQFNSKFSFKNCFKWENKLWCNAPDEEVNWRVRRPCY